MIAEVLNEDPIYEAIRAEVNKLKDKTGFQMDLIAEYDFIGLKAETNNTIGYIQYEKDGATVFEYD